MKAYKPNSTKLILMLSIALSSCLEQLDDVPKSFVRVFGSERIITVAHMTKLNNGHLLLYGEETMPASTKGPEQYFPYVLETDEFGNQIRYRNYMFYKSEFELRLSGVDQKKPDTHEFSTAWSHILSVKQLKDGSFFCLGWFGFGPEGTSYQNFDWEQESFYVLLDKNLEPTKWGFFDDSEIEDPPKFSTTIYGQNIHELSSGELIFSSAYTEYDDNLSPITQGFSVHKFLPQSGTTGIFRYPSGDSNLNWLGTGSILSNDATTLIVDVNQLPVNGLIGSGGFARTVQTSLFRIDLASGQVLNSRIYDTRGFSFNVERSDNGYVAQVYHPAPGEEIEANTRNWWGSLLFVDENLDSLKLVNITDTNNIAVGRNRIIRTRDGGYVTEFIRNPENGYTAVLIKTDADGNVLWRYEEGLDTAIADIVEMDDGGIAYAVSRDFNGLGWRVYLVKLTADGKL